MSLRFSKALRNYQADFGSVVGALAGGAIMVYSGTQPTTADDAATGTLLATFTLASGARTAEVRSAGGITISGASGSIDTLTVNSIEVMGASVPFNTSITQTAVDVCTQINCNPKNKLFVASNVAGAITLTAVQGLGALPNGWVVAGSGTTLTLGTAVAFAGGVNQVNGLLFNQAAAGVLSKKSSQTWSGVSAATGTAGWFRFVGPIADAGSTDSTESLCRLDGAIATSGSDWNMASTAFVSGATNTINTFDLTFPAA